MRDFLSGFFHLAHLALQNLNKDYIIFSNFCDFVVKTQNEKWDELLTERLNLNFQDYFPAKNCLDFFWKLLLIVLSFIDSSIWKNTIISFKPGHFDKKMYLFCYTLNWDSTTEVLPLTMSRQIRKTSQMHTKDFSTVCTTVYLERGNTIQYSIKQVEKEGYNLWELF